MCQNEVWIWGQLVTRTQAPTLATGLCQASSWLNRRQLHFIEFTESLWCGQLESHDVDFCTFVCIFGQHHFPLFHVGKRIPARSCAIQGEHVRTRQRRSPQSVRLGTCFACIARADATHPHEQLNEGNSSINSLPPAWGICSIICRPTAQSRVGMHVRMQTSNGTKVVCVCVRWSYRHSIFSLEFVVL